MAGETVTIDLEALISHAEKHGRRGLNRVECAVLDGIIEGCLRTYLAWYRMLWR